MVTVARPNPKGAPSAARGASSWVADLEAYSHIGAVHFGHVFVMHMHAWACVAVACLCVFPSHAESERQGSICCSPFLTIADGIMHM